MKWGWGKGGLFPFLVVTTREKGRVEMERGIGSLPCGHHHRVRWKGSGEGECLLFSGNFLVVTTREKGRKERGERGIG